MFFTSYSMHATTSGPEAAGLVSASPELEARTVQTVFHFDDGAQHLTLFRESTLAPGMYSPERYTLNPNTDEWLPHAQGRKARFKVPPECLPFPPHGAAHEVIEGIDAWTQTPMTAEERGEFARRVRTGKRRQR